MNIVQHLAEIVSVLAELQIPHLVMGGHAVRYYGFSRETTDHDLCIPPEHHLKLTDPLSARHLAMVEAVRLRYKRAMQELDRKEKDEHRIRNVIF